MNTTWNRCRRIGARPWLVCAAVIASFALSGLSFAAEVSPQLTAIPADVELRITDDGVMLAIDEAISLALERNLGLRVERHVASSSEFQLLGTEGIYDINTTIDLSTFEETAPTASNLEAGVGATVQAQEGQSLNFGANRLLPGGGVVGTQWNNSRFESNSLFSTLNPSYRVDFDLSFTQPLLRNRGRLATERNITVARTNLEISREQFEQRVIETIQAVANTYWDLIDAREQLVVALESLELARELHEQNRIRVEVGTLAPLELVQSEAGVAARELDIIRAEVAVGNAEDLLRQLLNLPRTELWDRAIVPETELSVQDIDFDLETTISEALANRPELKSKQLAVENQRVDAAFFRNQQRSRLDLSLRYGLNGLGGDLTQRDFFTSEILLEAPGGYGDALDQVTSGDFDGWSAAFNFAYPIRNRSARAQTAIADLAVEQGETEFAALELDVVTDVRRGARLLLAAVKAVQSAGVSRRLEERNLEAEQKRFANGMSTSFQVLQIQEDLTSARSLEVAAITAYRKSLVEFYRAAGGLLEATEVEIAGP